MNTFFLKISNNNSNSVVIRHECGSPTLHDLGYCASFRFLFRCFNLVFSAPNLKGQNGAVSASNLHHGALDATSKRSFPVELIVIMKRQVEDLLLGNIDDQKGKEAVQFILSLANERNDVDQIKKGLDGIFPFFFLANYYWQSRTRLSRIPKV